MKNLQFIYRIIKKRYDGTRIVNKKCHGNLKGWQYIKIIKLP
jgi:hypothetical protein